MSEEINQKIGHGAHNNSVVGQQNNYYGMTAEEAAKMAVELFNDNFPKLQEIAKDIASQRATEFCQTTIENLVNQKIEDFSVFSDPDMQYVLVNAQKDYARFGTQELLQRLTTLICKRVLANDDDTLKAVINSAIETAKYLTESHMDLLSLIFLTKHISLNKISKIADYTMRLNELNKSFNSYAQIFSKANTATAQCLQNFNCLMINLGDADESLAKNYNLKQNDVKAILPKVFKTLHSDYGLSYTGIVLALINTEHKTNLKLNMREWIK